MAEAISPGGGSVAPAPPPRNIRATLKLFRFEPGVETEPKFSHHDVEMEARTTVLEALLHVMDTQDGSLAVRYSCRHAVCGSCAMNINGKNRLACQAPMSELGPEVTVMPLTGLPVVRDLVCDMRNFFKKFESVKPWLIEKAPPPEKENLQSPKERKRIEHEVTCIMCGCCEGSCPVLWGNENYLGPAAIAKAWRFIGDSRDGNVKERLAVLDSEYGVWRCRTAFGCVEACPRGIPLTESIERTRRRILKYKLTGR
jgi:succinate dehydrogenase / fumarate reductase iron-sulfur subunit